MYNPTVPFSQEQIDLIEKSGLSMAELRDFWSRFPEQELDAAIGGALEEKKAKEAGLTTGLEASTLNPDVPAPAESGPELEDSKLMSEQLNQP